MPGRAPLIVFAVIALMAGGGVLLSRGDRLDLDTENEVSRNYERIAVVCQSRAPSPAQVRAATRSLAVLIVQYGRTPDGTAMVVESSDPSSMREILGAFTDGSPRYAHACEPIQQAARAALRYDR